MFVFYNSEKINKILKDDILKLEKIYKSWYYNTDFLEYKRNIYLIPLNEKKPLLIRDEFAIPIYLMYPVERILWYITHEITEFFILKRYGYIKRWFYEGFAQINGFEMIKNLYSLDKAFEIVNQYYGNSKKINNKKICQLKNWKNAFDIINNIPSDNINDILKTLKYYIFEYHETEIEKENYYYSFLLFYKMGINANIFEKIIKKLENINDHDQLIEILLEVNFNAESKKFAEKFKKTNCTEKY
ncbi:hypothetical protein Marpi_0116 [Marinitoga piezophila KA3]|uniref:Uncharacterized protein n=1 Tax=Marinitoga piezophila (strain DSM 14283 / JCM 11233 / KA3) TaxID=443254 RepID=H2J355_MARPK|nr:hypothetical protein [Marinitoga piezophila]AEX84573.1 hypothetical protein Marpi_0116 [Marinitoga piezophila KA3]